jgi:hypothetical protein
MLDEKAQAIIGSAADLLAAEQSDRAAEMLYPAMREVAEAVPLSGPGSRERWVKALKLLGDTCHVIAKWAS